MPPAAAPVKRRELSNESVIRIAETTLRTKLENGTITQEEYELMVGTHLRMQAATERERRAIEGGGSEAEGRETEVLDLRPVERAQPADPTPSASSSGSQGWRGLFSPSRPKARKTPAIDDDWTGENSAGETDGETRGSDDERRNRRPATDEEAEDWTKAAIRRWDGEADSSENRSRSGSAGASTSSSLQDGSGGSGGSSGGSSGDSSGGSSGGVDREDLVQLARLAGLPSSGPTRQEAWARLAGVHRVSTGGLGFEALRREVVVSEKVLHKIRKDTRRSCCTETFRLGLDGSESGPLFGVLRSYAALDPQIGYVQGMNYVAALCVIDAPSAESGFNLFCRLMQGTSLRRLYDSKDELIHHLILHIDQQVARNAPELHAHMEEQGFLVQCYAVEWLTTLLIYNVPYVTAAAIFGLYLVEGGLSFIVQLGVALLIRQGEQLCKLSLEHILPQYTAHLKNLSVPDMLDALQTLEANAVLHLKRPRYGKALADHGFKGVGDLEQATYQELLAAGFEDADAELVLGMGAGDSVRLGRL